MASFQSASPSKSAVDWSVARKDTSTACGNGSRSVSGDYSEERPVFEDDYTDGEHDHHTVGRSIDQSSPSADVKRVDLSCIDREPQAF